MPATKKIARETQDQDLSQLQNIFAKSTPAAEQKAAEPVVTDLINEEKTAAVNQQEQRMISDTKIGIRLTTDKKNELKAYFISHGVTVSQGVLDAYELLKRFESEGKVAYKNGILNVF